MKKNIAIPAIVIVVSILFGVGYAIAQGVNGWLSDCNGSVVITMLGNKNIIQCVVSELYAVVVIDEEENTTAFFPLVEKSRAFPPPILTKTAEAARTETSLPSGTVTSTLKPTSTLSDEPTVTPTSGKTTPTSTDIVAVTPTSPPEPGEPFPDAPLCESHDFNEFHTLWNRQIGCHYDHEHGASPFTQAVSNAFPGFNLLNLLGGVEIGHTNPSSAMENNHKHGGMKWQVDVPAVQGCKLGFESGEVAIDAAAIQYHGFGDYSIEFETRIHSIAALLRQCKDTNSDDKGYIYMVQHVDYGQRVSPYQGIVLQYPDTPNPGFNSGLAPYFTVDCVGTERTGCRESLSFVLSRNLNANSLWTSKSPHRVSPSGSPLLGILFRVRDIYQLINSGSLTHPFEYLWLCSNDGGLTYAAKPGCRYNNSTTEIHEVQGRIPSEWDNLEGFDTNPTVGRITADGFVTRFGELNTQCTTSDIDCHPIKMIDAFVGFYSTELSAAKVSSPTPFDTPERDIYFCSGIPCKETDFGAISSGWIGENN
jgi:hypothetical protein